MLVFFYHSILSFNLTSLLKLNTVLFIKSANVSFCPPLLAVLWLAGPVVVQSPGCGPHDRGGYGAGRYERPGLPQPAVSVEDPGRVQQPAPRGAHRLDQH